MKRLWVLLLGLAVALTGCTSASASVEKAETAFSDIPEGAWYAEAAVWCAEQGIMKGMSATEFSPDGTLTRATLATVLHRAAGTPKPGKAADFSDVPINAWYTDAVAWASENNLMSGYGGGRFGVNDPVTREQLAAILWRWAGRPAGAAREFADRKQVAGYAAIAASWAVEDGLLRTRIGNRFAPREAATRAEIAESVYRYMTNAAPKLLYMGQASIRVVTPENKVIYIDPYAGDAYDLPADLILVTHGHFDHCAVEKVTNRSANCRIITHREAAVNGEHKIFELPYVTVEAVEAGYNRLHDVNVCVGYVLTFRNGKKVYVTGDTSATKQMERMSEMEIDYAFYCCDGVYNMGMEESAKCAELVGAKHNIPYHISTSNSGEMFDRKSAERWDAPNRLIVYPGEEIEIR